MALRDALNGKLDKLAEQTDQILADITSLNAEEEKLVSLLREAAVLEERNKMHSVLLERARLNDVLDESQITSINVVQPASFEARPVTPNKRMCAMMGMLCAILISLTLPVLLDTKKILAAAAANTLDDSGITDDHPDPNDNQSSGQAEFSQSIRVASGMPAEGLNGGNEPNAKTSASVPLRVTPSPIDQPPTLPR